MEIHVEDIRPVKLIAKVEGVETEVLRIMSLTSTNPDVAEAIVATDNVTAFVEAKLEVDAVTLKAVVKIMVNGEARAVSAESAPFAILPKRMAKDPATGEPIIKADGTPMEVLHLDVEVTE